MTANTSDHRPVIGIDLGGTKIRSVVTRHDGEILGEDVRMTDAEAGQEVVVGRLVASARAAAAASGLRPTDIVAAGVTAPGTVDFDAGVLHQPPNLPGWDAVPLAQLLTGPLGCPVFLENDANAAAYGEWRHGAGTGLRHMIYLTVSTGIGAGLILNGGLYRGADGAAGELGHITVDVTGPEHNCGMVGCVEVMASGTAIARMAHEAYTAGRSPELARLAAERGELTAAEVDEAAELGDPVADEILGRAATYLGIGLASYINIFNPEAIVIGGGVSKIGARLLEPAFALAKRRAFRLPSQRVSLRLAALEGRAEVLGVAALARDSV
ncbi:MAG: ROK family protein [Chloroflexi bacterium]|nr:ROK family protein [Chloroflexota bacterium]